ncbi:MAG: hypothetical protein M1827_006069 [Pycnora praestabilis]|nr:MAG: hypothetical protein M1827_006069 [Pycnora praestabilis]
MHFSITSTTLVALVVGLTVRAAPTPAESLNILPKRFLSPDMPLRFNVRNMASKKDTSNSSGNNVDIFKITEIDIEESQRRSEIELIIIVEDMMPKNHKIEKKKDDARKNAFKEKNRTKSTVIQIIQVIIDIRQGSNNMKTRYAKHHITADNRQNATATDTVQVTDAQTMTIANGTDVAAASNAVISGAGTGTGTSLAALQTLDPNAPFNLSNNTVLEQPEVPAPVWPDVEADPAASMATAGTIV